MADKKELEELRAIGVKSATFLHGNVASVEFFPLPTIPPLIEPDTFAADTLVPPAPPEDEPPNTEPRARHYAVPPALAAILAKPSVS